MLRLAQRELSKVDDARTAQFAKETYKSVFKTAILSSKQISQKLETQYTCWRMKRLEGDLEERKRKSEKCKVVSYPELQDKPASESFWYEV